LQNTVKIKLESKQGEVEVDVHILGDPKRSRAKAPRRKVFSILLCALAPWYEILFIGLDAAVSEPSSKE